MRRSFLQPDAEALALVFEFLESMLLHEVQDAFHFGKIHAANGRARLGCVNSTFSPFRVLEIPGKRWLELRRLELLPALRPRCGCRRSLRYIHPARLLRPYPLRSRVSSRAQPRHFVDFDAQAVASAVGEVTVQALALADFTRCSVHVARP